MNNSTNFTATEGRLDVQAIETRYALRVAGLACTALWLAFAGFDYAETWAQCQQLHSATPGDGVAPWVKTSKIATYLLGVISFFGILIWRARQGDKGVTRVV